MLSLKYENFTYMEAFVAHRSETEHVGLWIYRGQILGGEKMMTDKLDEGVVGIISTIRTVRTYASQVVHLFHFHNVENIL